MLPSARSNRVEAGVSKGADLDLFGRRLRRTDPCAIGLSRKPTCSWPKTPYWTSELCRKSGLQCCDGCWSQRYRAIQTPGDSTRLRAKVHPPRHILRPPPNLRKSSDGMPPECPRKWNCRHRKETPSKTHPGRIPD